MRNLFAFFNRFQIFLFFILLQVVSISLYINYFSFPKSQYLTSASIVSGNVLKVKYNVTKLLNLTNTNNNLQKELAQLRKERPESFIQIDRKLFKINDTLNEFSYDYIPAIVINSTFDKRNNFFTLDIGSKQGVEREMGVMSGKGIVGIVHYTSEHFSVVKSVLTQNINLDVMVEESGAFGLLKWDNNNVKYGNISGISNDMSVKKWSKIVTRGGSGIFPRGIPVGKISKIKSVEGKPLWDIEILFAEDFRKIQRVYVIKNLLKIEQKKLESKIPIDPEE